MTGAVLLSHVGDEDAARRIVGALVESDVDIFWQRPSQPDASRAARAVVYLHSTLAAPEGEDEASDAVLARVRAARARDALIVVRLDRSPLPEWLSGTSTYDIRGWRQRAASMFMLDLVAAVRAKIAGLDPPLPRAPRQLLLRRILFATPALLGAVALAIGLYRDTGLDRVAGAEEKAAWSSRKAGSCDDLRQYLATYPDGAYSGEAQALLAAADTRRETRTSVREDTLIAFETSDGANRSAAATALDRAIGDKGERMCRQLAENGGTRFVSVTVEDYAPTCTGFGATIECSAEATIVCELEEARQNETLVCR